MEVNNQGVEANNVQNVNDAPLKKRGKSCWLIGIIIVIALILFGAGGAYAVYKFTNINLGPVSRILGPKLDSNCKYNDPDLCKFVNNWKNVEFMNMTSTYKDATGVDQKMSFMMQGKDKNQLTIWTNGNENYNTIFIGKTTYTKDYSDSKWFKYTALPTDTTNGQINNEFKFDEKAAQADDKTTYKKMGTEPCGKLTCFKYEVVSGTESDAHEFIYFDNKEYLMRKTRTEYSNGTVAEATIDYSKFTISEPTPVKEGDPLDSASVSPTAPIPSSVSSTNSNSTSNSVQNDTSAANDTPPADVSPQDETAVPLNE